MKTPVDYRNQMGRGPLPVTPSDEVRAIIDAAMKEATTIPTVGVRELED